MSKAQIFKQFLETNDILIVDKNSGSRNRLVKMLYDLGAKRHMIFTAGHLVEAQQIIESKNIALVLSDYFIGGGSGFDLFKLLREKNPRNKDLCLVLVTSNISQTAVAKAAEEDVDSFIIKPYTMLSMQENLISTVVNKIQPSEYLRNIEHCKALVKDHNYDEAMEILNQSLALHPRPALALFYMGQIEYLKSQLDEASGAYNKGLSFNNIHYKCLVGLYDLFMEREKYTEAYFIVKKIAKYFPANPDRLAQIIRLAIRTQNYSDLQTYYEIFTTLDVRVQALVNYIGAGMFVAGKHFLKTNDQETALRYFENIGVSCSEYPKFLRAIVSILIENSMPEEASKYLERFDPETKAAEDYLVSEYLVLSATSEDTGLIIKNGVNLYNQKIRDNGCLHALILAMTKAGHSEDKLTEFKTALKSAA